MTQVSLDASGPPLIQVQNMNMNNWLKDVYVFDEVIYTFCWFILPQRVTEFGIDFMAGNKIYWGWCIHSLFSS